MENKNKMENIDKAKSYFLSKTHKTNTSLAKNDLRIAPISEVGND